MKLTELEPRWIGGSLDDGAERRGLGISFMCPLHHVEGDRLAVWFSNPCDGGSAHVDYAMDSATAHLTLKNPEHLWQRTGETFDDLTLTPSIDASKYGCWHGFITNGAIA
jgi:hypothetical protein